jgi:hypothetical protein
MIRRLSRSVALSLVLSACFALAGMTRVEAEVRFGPPADVAAVSALATSVKAASATLGPVVVVGTAAYFNIYWHDSAEYLAKKVNGKWKVVERTGGAGTAATYAQYTHGALTAAQICALGHHIPESPITDCR